jgi:hypothetical protein
MMNSEKTKEIYSQAQEAQKLLENLKNGNNVLDISGHEIETCKIKLMQMLHFRQYTCMYKFAFQEWDVNTSLEQTYIEIGVEARNLNILLNHDVFKETLCSLLWIQAENENKTIEEIHDEYMQEVGKQWMDAGLIQGLRMNIS